MYGPLKDNRKIAGCDSRKKGARSPAVVAPLLGNVTSAEVTLAQSEKAATNIRFITANQVEQL